jgi:hypothetical protein
MKITHTKAGIKKAEKFSKSKISMKKNLYVRLTKENKTYLEEFSRYMGVSQTECLNIILENVRTDQPGYRL